MQDEKQASTTSGYPMLVVLPVSIATGIAGASSAWGEFALKAIGDYSLQR